jgi:hypothetical protein
MPAKKAAAKKTGKPAKTKAKPKAASKPKPKTKPAKIVSPKPKKQFEKKPVIAPTPKPKPVFVPAPIAPPEPPIDPKDLIECEHCDGTGKCAAGQPYDKSHHQGIFGKLILTSCMDCLVASSESHNSKKMVDCRFCRGTGKVAKQRPM